jgi:hypothetical protein
VSLLQTVVKANTCHTLDRNNIIADRDVCGIMDGDELNSAVEAIFNVKYHPYVQSDYISACITDAFLDSPQNVLLIPLAAVRMGLALSVGLVLLASLSL